MAVRIERRGTVGIVTMDNPPVNAIGLAVRSGLEQAVDWAENEPGLTHVVLTGSGRCFAAGGDAREFDAPPVEPHLPDVIARIESSTVPWVAAINGLALGGGLELALGCRWRIAAPGVSLGLPEVTLGVVPGAGGTQRLPRLIGVANAVAMISTGKPILAEQGLSWRVIDAIASDPVGAALSLDRKDLDEVRQIRALPAAILDAASIEGARAAARKRLAGQLAPQRAIDLVEASCTHGLDEGLHLERSCFLELKQGLQSRALRHLFFAERAARPPSGLNAASAELDHVAVVGGGTMGAGIAYALLNAGLRVTLLETDDAAVQRASINVERIVAQSQKRGLIDASGAAERMHRFRADADYHAASTANLAIEAAFESMDVKHTVFAQLEAALPDDAILATNTSYLDINQIAARMADPSRVLGLHFFAPAHIMKLLEIIRPDRASDRAVATGFALAKRLKKVPVLSGVCDGFIGNRILARYREAADAILIDGAMPWEIDEAMVGFGYAMGIYETQDLSGLDIAFANRRRQDANRDPKRRYVPIGDEMVHAGRLGRKTGAGWYAYPDGGAKQRDPAVEQIVLAESKKAGIHRRSFETDAIVRQLVLAMVNEAADILHEGIAQSASDIDLVSVFGYGFPRWRGGLMHYADTIGVPELVAQLQELGQADPVMWSVSPALTKCLDLGWTLAEYRRAE